MNEINTNELIKKLDDNLEKMSLDLKFFVEKISSQSENIHNSKPSYEKFSTSFLGYIRDIITSVVFFTLMVSAASFFLIKKEGLEGGAFSEVVLRISVIIGMLPSFILFFKLTFNWRKARSWKIVGIPILVFIVLVLLNFSLYKLFPDVMNILEGNGLVN